MDNADKQKFITALRDYKIPITEADWENRFQQYLTEAGSSFNNASAQSPFHRILRALAVKPATLFTDYLIHGFLANSFLKTASGSFLTLRGWGQKTARKNATKTKGNISITRSSADESLLIPAGTIIETPPIGAGDMVYKVLTEKDQTVPAGALEYDIAVTAENKGESYNLGANYYTLLTTPIAGIISVTNKSDWITSAGTNDESDDSYRLRLRNRWKQQSEWFTHGAYRAMIASFPGIDPDEIWFSNNTPRGAGSNNAYIMLNTGRPSQKFLDTINSYINDGGHHGPGDDLKVFAMPQKKISLKAEIKFDNKITSDIKNDTINNIKNFIKAAFRENTNYSPTKASPQSLFSVSRLAGEVMREFPLPISVVIEPNQDIEFKLEQGVLELTVNEV